MFSTAEKAKIAKVVEETIKSLNHPEMDNNHIRFDLHVYGKEGWSFADIHENSRVGFGKPNPWNEVAREVLGKGDK